MIIIFGREGYTRDGIRRYHKSGGGYNAPPPDPALVAAQIKSMGVQDQVMRQMMDNTEKNAPLIESQMKLGIRAQETAYDQSQDDRTWMLSRREQLSGQQDQLTQDAEDFNQADRQEQMARDAMGDVNAGYANAEAQGSRNLAARGVNANSGAALALNKAASTGKAQALAGAANAARTGARAEGRALTDRAVNALAGYPAMGMSATGAGAGFGANGMSVAVGGQAGMNAGLTAVGGMAGALGQNATGMYGQQAGFKAKMESADASGSAGASAGMGAAVGGIAIAI